MIAPGKPKGTVPVLALPDGTFIKQSLAILDYLEDICDNPQEEWQKDLTARAKPSMRGGSARERATTREILALADEAASLFGFACHKGTKLFATREPVNPSAARFAMAWVKKNLKLLEAYYEGRFEGDDSDGEKVTVADCVLFSLLQFAKELYAQDLVADAEFLNLRRFYNVFKEKESARIPEDFYPREFKELACVWLE